MVIKRASLKRSNAHRKLKRVKLTQHSDEDLTDEQLFMDCLNMEFTKNSSLQAIKTVITQAKAKVSDLENSKHLNWKPKLKTTHVIYVIYNTIDNLKYIGQTSKDGISRFLEHLQAAARINKEGNYEHYKMSKQRLLYTHMLKTGVKFWRTFPIVGINSYEYQWQQLADQFEFIWIHMFNTLKPKGLNMILPNTIHQTIGGK